MDTNKYWWPDWEHLFDPQPHPLSGGMADGAGNDCSLLVVDVGNPDSFKAAVTRGLIQRLSCVSGMEYHQNVNHGHIRSWETLLGNVYIYIYL